MWDVVDKSASFEGPTLRPSSLETQNAVFGRMFFTFTFCSPVVSLKVLFFTFKFTFKITFRYTFKKVKGENTLM